MTEPLATRRTVKGTAYRDCNFCGRNRTDKNNRPFNYQYRDDSTGEWDENVYCSKECRKAWVTMNANAEKIRRAGVR